MTKRFADYRATRAKLPRVTEEHPARFIILRSDWELLKHGFWPRDMDDRWLAGYRRPWLELYRSWTDTLVFSVRIDDTADEVVAGPVRAARNEDWYRPVSAEKEVSLVRDVVGSLADILREDGLRDWSKNVAPARHEGARDGR